ACEPRGLGRRYLLRLARSPLWCWPFCTRETAATVLRQSAACANGHPDPARGRGGHDQVVGVSAYRVAIVGQ
ncbi:MAG TPA: hypothetical protein VN748_22240, partial [Pseudonocardiaceae bacterium]|nr:hypothetical protein [Pseudonocardiaceae bacterium]